MFRLRRLFHIGFLVSAGLTITLCVLHLYFLSREQRLITSVDLLMSRGFLVDTSACRIPDLDPFDSSIIDYVRKKGRIRCLGKPSVTYVDGVFLRINRTRVEKELGGDFKHCRYQPISREQVKSDFAFAYGDLGERFDHDIEVEDEFMRIYCYSQSEGVVSTTFHAFVLPKAEVERRCRARHQEHVHKHKPREVLNVLMVGVDSTSRLNMIRQMPRTRHVLLKELDAVEMMGYNKVADNTFVNIVPMTTGKFVEELPWNETMAGQPFDNYTFIWNNFSQAGYRTLYAEDAPKIAIFVYQKEGFHEAPADYYNRAMALAMEKHGSVWNHKHHCVADMLETDMLLNYVTDFSRQFQQKPHFAFTFITRLTHDNVNDAGAADEPHVNFLKNLKEKGLLNNTVLLYYSDHGNRFGEARNTYVGKAEERLPFLFLVLPPWFKTKYPKLYQNLHINSNRLTTPFDVFETLKDILYFNGESRHFTVRDRGISLFSEIPEKRSCAHAHILPHWCMCMQREHLPVSDSVVLKIAKQLVDIINSYLALSLDVCARLKLDEILTAEQMVANDDMLRFQESLHDVVNRTVLYGNRTDSVTVYQLTLRTKPGGALFESTVKYDDATDYIALAGDISRINEYGTQSDCIASSKLKKFCYCK